ncbi:MAG: cupredoxin domain-containing protein [Nitriliruptorales bacterium]
MRRLVLSVAAALLLAACGGGGGGGGDGGGGGGGETLSITGTNSLEFEPDQLEAPAGTITIELTSEDRINHTFVIEELGDEEVVGVDAGATASGDVELEPGTYTFYCSVPGHRAAGMEGELVIE